VVASAIASSFRLSIESLAIGSTAAALDTAEASAQLFDPKRTGPPGHGRSDP